MKSVHHTPARTIARSVLGGICLAGITSGCGGSPTETDAIGDGLRDEGGSLAQELRAPSRGGPARAPGRHRHRRGHAGGGSHGEAPPPPACSVGDQDALFQTLNADLGRLDVDDLPFARYLTLADRAAVVGCGAALDADRAALTKLINSVSIDASLEAPVAVNADETLYRIDLRDFAWDRAIVVGAARFDDAWEALIAQSPYALPYVGDDADDATEDTGTSIPVLFGSAFVAAAARAPLYYSLLDIPADSDDFLANELGIDVPTGESARAGFTADTRVGEAEFLAQRFDLEVRAGVAWQISEFGADLFDDPLGAARGEREIVFSLPNGLQGHILADGNGRVRASSDVLADRSESDGRAHIATSFFASRAGGVELEDEVRAFVQANPGNFNAAERAAILAAYPSAAQLQQLLASDRDSFFNAALTRLGLDIDTTPEPISQSFADFNADVDLATAASELFLSQEELLDNIDLLDPVFSVLDGGGRIDRDDFTLLYPGAACIFTVVLENQVDPAVCDEVFGNP
ncbi:MAG: hypothetical protein ABI895_12060 [Deltaproteobacteria bacterium]